MELFRIRRDNFKKTQKYKDGQKRYHQKPEVKTRDNERVKAFQKTEAGKIVKRRADKKYKNSVGGRLHTSLNERLRAMKHGKGWTSKKVLKWMGFSNASEVDEWIDSMLPPGADLKDFQLDHVIPFLAYKWKRVGWAIVRDDTVSEAEFRKLWHKDNIQLLPGTENQKKMVALPDDSMLLSRRHLWPVWWQDKLPDSSLRSKIKCCRGKDVMM